MITLELIFENLWVFIKNTVISICVICVIGKLLGFAFNIDSLYTVTAVFVAFVLVAIGTLYTPLFTDYREYVKISQEMISNLQADNNILQANQQEMLAEIEQVKKDKSNLQATIANKEQEISRLQNQESKQIAHLQIALAEAKQNYATLEQQATTAGEIHLAVKAQLDQLKGMENYLFLKQIAHPSINPEKVADSLIKVIAGIQKGMSDSEKERVQGILAKVKNGNVIDV